MAKIEELLKLTRQQGAFGPSPYAHLRGFHQRTGSQRYVAERMVQRSLDVVSGANSRLRERDNYISDLLFDFRILQHSEADIVLSGAFPLRPFKFFPFQNPKIPYSDCNISPYCDIEFTDCPQALSQLIFMPVR